MGRVLISLGVRALRSPTVLIFLARTSFPNPRDLRARWVKKTRRKLLKNQKIRSEVLTTWWRKSEARQPPQVQSSQPGQGRCSPWRQPEALDSFQKSGKTKTAFHTWTDLKSVTPNQNNLHSRGENIQRKERTRHFLELLKPGLCRFLGLVLKKPFVGVVTSWNKEQKVREAVWLRRKPTPPASRIPLVGGCC